MFNALVIMKKICAAFIIMHHLIEIKNKQQQKKKIQALLMKHLQQSKYQYDSAKLLNILSIDESKGYFNNFIHMSMNDFENFITMI